MDDSSCEIEEFKCYDNSCTNRFTEIECSPDCGEGCQNQRISEKKGAKTEVFMTQDKGRGVSAAQSIKKGDYIMEYIGEVVRKTTYEQRMEKRYRKDTHRYAVISKGTS